MIMSIFFKARSGSFAGSVGIFLIRLTLGTLFLLAGAGKVLHLQDFIQSVQDMGQMNNTIAFVLAFILPFMELIFGALFIIGLFTPITSFVLACLTFSFLIVLGPGHPELPFSHNFVFLACFISTIFTGAGLISFDALGDQKKEDKGLKITVEKEKDEPKIFDAGKINESDAIFVDENEVRKD
jgi:uncharacterized membrane protein YphA (DoxX/SURF4 family)